MRDLTFERSGAINNEKLSEDLIAALGATFMGLAVKTRNETSTLTVRVDDRAKTSEENRVRDIVAAHTPDAKSTRQANLANILNTAKGAEGMALVDLSAGQIKALLAVLLYKAGGVNDDGTVKALSQWVRD